MVDIVKIILSGSYWPEYSVAWCVLEWAWILLQQEKFDL